MGTDHRDRTSLAALTSRKAEMMKFPSYPSLAAIFKMGWLCQYSAVEETGGLVDSYDKSNFHMGR